MEMRYATKKATTTKKAPPKKATAKSKKAEAEKRVMSMSYKDVIIMFLADGLSAIEKLYKAEKIKPTTLHRAAEGLKKNHPERADMLTAFVEKNAPSAGRGRLAPQPGEVRDYKAQRFDEGEPFIRLPLGVLTVKKGELVSVRFDADRFMVTKKTG